MSEMRRKWNKKLFFYTHDMNKLSFFIYFCKWYIIYYENTYKIILTTRFNSP